jgi:hypothetical protein
VKCGVCVALLPRMQSSKISIHPQWNVWLPMSWHYVRHAVCDAPCTMMASGFSFGVICKGLCSWHKKLLGLYVWVGIIQHDRIIFFACIRVLTESQYTDWSRSCDWCWSKTCSIVCLNVYKSGEWYFLWYRAESIIFHLIC